MYSKVVLNPSFLLLLNINAILKKVENQTVAGPQYSLRSYLLMWMYVALYWYGTAKTAADRMCAVARYNNISSKADRGDIFIRATAGQMGALSRILLLCPLPQIL